MPSVACFDTTFHRQPAAGPELALASERFHEEGRARYGFHGPVLQFVSGRLSEGAGAQPGPPAQDHRSTTWATAPASRALKQAQRGHATMGFTAVEGLMMGTRSAPSIPGDALIYLTDPHGMDARALEDMNHKGRPAGRVRSLRPDMRD